MIVLILIIIILVVAIVVIFEKLKKKGKDKVSDVISKIKEEPVQRYLEPEEFFVGRIPMKTYESSNLCNNKVLYPINGLDVDYGSKMPPNCPMYEFIQVP